MVYVFKNSVADWTVADLELVFENDRLAFFRSVNGGDRIEVSTRRWSDPMAYPDKDTLEFIFTSGKWTKVNMNDEPLYSRYLKRVFEGFSPIRSEFGEVVGFELHFEEDEIATVYTGCDETLFFPCEKRDELMRMGWELDDEVLGL